MFLWTLEPNFRVSECFEILILLCNSLHILSKKVKFAYLKRLRHTAKGHRSTSSCFEIWLDRCSLRSAMYQSVLRDQRVLREITTMTCLICIQTCQITDCWQIKYPKLTNKEQAFAITNLNYAKPDAVFATEMLQNLNILRKQGFIARNWLKLAEFCLEIPDVFRFLRVFYRGLIILIHCVPRSAKFALKWAPTDLECLYSVLHK